MPPVSNAGPLLVLAKLNALYLLKLLYGRVHVPSSVYSEVVVQGMRQGYEDARTLQIFLEQVQWFTEDVDEANIPATLRTATLDRGERDALVLAASLRTTVLMDETAGRKVARELGVPVRGSLGILIEAFRKNIITADQLRIYFAEIARRHDVWISPALVRRLEQELFGGE